MSDRVLSPCFVPLPPTYTTPTTTNRIWRGPPPSPTILLETPSPRQLRSLSRSQELVKPSHSLAQAYRVLLCGREQPQRLR